MLVLLAATDVAAAPDLQKAGAQFLTGDYAGCLSAAEAALLAHPDNEDWLVLHNRVLLMTGRYPQAVKAITNAVAQDRWSVRLCWEARRALQSNGQTESADEMAQRIVQMVSRHPADYRDVPSLVIFGQAVLAAGADPKRVLDTVFNPAKKADPKGPDAYVAAGMLALAKHDYGVAAKQFEEGLKQLPDNPDLHFGLAAAYAPSDAALMSASLEAALERNSNHVDCLLLLADRCIDAEDYEQADKFLDRVKAVNPWHPDMWAYRAVLAHLRNQPEAEPAARRNALKFWPANPRVDHLIGSKLSQNYRFTEGAGHQRQALGFDPEYLPAKAQLAQDLLRLGEENEGWQLAEQVQKQDNYDVEAFNLATLHDSLRKFTTLTNHDFLLRMAPHEAAVYGQRVLDLLSRARASLCPKYGFEVVRPTIVEVFAEQKDFAVRTFGLPGNPGYLGVCFGTVITANSPAARSHPINWESMLWHEFCHVVTLQATRNKMPRWLSEGISVYEERQANPAWGQRMNPHYREMLLGEDFTPLSKLSGAFLAPKSDLHLQFAYYESSLAVEFLVQRFGMDALKAILADLGNGLGINQAIEKHTLPMSKLEPEFAAFAQGAAQKLAPGLDFEKPSFAASDAKGRRPRGRSPTGPEDSVPSQGRAAMDDEAWQKWAENRPTNFWVMTRRAADLVERKEWAQAKPILQRLITLYPGCVGAESPYPPLAAAHRGLGETNEERAVLAQWAEKDDEAADAYLRLMELSAAAQDWPAVLQNAQRYLAVNPLVSPPYRFLAEAGEQTGNNPLLVSSYRALLEMDPADPADVHYHLARALFRLGDPSARRHVLQALEEAPGYRAALELLLQINGEGPRQESQTLRWAPDAKKPRLMNETCGYEPKPSAADESGRNNKRTGYLALQALRELQSPEDLAIAFGVQCIPPLWPAPKTPIQADF